MRVSRVDLPQICTVFSRDTYQPDILEPLLEMLMCAAPLQKQLAVLQMNYRRTCSHDDSVKDTLSQCVIYNMNAKYQHATGVTSKAECLAKPIEHCCHSDSVHDGGMHL